MSQNIDNLFIEKYEPDSVLKLCNDNKEKGFEYLANGILSWIANLYIPDDNENLEPSEILELKNASKNQLETLLLNFQDVIDKFFTYQRTKNGIGLYFKYYDNIIFKTPIVFDTIIDDESIKHPVFNKIFILSAYTLQFLLSHYYSEIDDCKKIIAYLKQQQETTNHSPLEIFILNARLHKLEK